MLDNIRNKMYSTVTTTSTTTQQQHQQQQQQQQQQKVDLVPGTLFTVLLKFLACCCDKNTKC